MTINVVLSPKLSSKDKQFENAGFEGKRTNAFTFQNIHKYLIIPEIIELCVSRKAEDAYSTCAPGPCSQFYWSPSCSFAFVT